MLTLFGCADILVKLSSDVDLDDTAVPSTDTDADSDTDSDADTDADADSDTDTDSDSDTDTDTDTEPATRSWSPGTVATTIPTGLSFLTVHLADVTGDGNLDLIWVGSVEWSGPITHDLFVMQGAGDGSFAAVQRTAGVGLSDATGPFVDVADHDGDGATDVVIATVDGFVYYRSMRDGTFDRPVMTAASSSVAGLGAADYDGDGTRDLLLRERVPDAVEMWSGDGSGGFSDPLRVLESAAGTTAIFGAADTDGDGRAEAIFSDEGDVDHGHSVAWSDSTGTGTIYVYDVDFRFSDDGAWYPHGIDTDGDGLDEVVSIGSDGLQLWSPITGAATVVRLRTGDASSRGNVVADLDGDGREDVLEVIEDGEYPYAFTRFAWAQGDGTTLTSAGEATVGATCGTTQGQVVAAGDLDGDRCADIAFIVDNPMPEIWVAPGVCSST